MPAVGTGARSSMSLKVIGIAAIRQVVGLYHLLSGTCSNNVAILHHFQDITTFIVYT